MNSTIWSTERIETTLSRIKRGEMDINMSCFHERDVELRAKKLAFQLTQWEEEEFEKCSSDIVYFVETYCKFLTDYGRVLVKLREYQRDILNIVGEEEWIDELQDFGPKNRSSIILSARQTGKCQLFDSQITIRNNLSKKESKISIGKLYDLISNGTRNKSIKYRILNFFKKCLYNIYNKLS